VVSTEPGHAVCAGRGETRRVRIALVGEVAVGEWLLVFIDSAHERLDLMRAQEIGATLDLLQRALSGLANGALSGDLEVPFDLPSRQTTEQLQVLADATAQPTVQSQH